MSRRTPIQRVARNLRGNLFGVGDLTEQAKAQWDAAVASFQEKRDQLTVAENDLWNVQGAAWSDPADKAAWQSAMNKIYYAEKAMDAAASGAVNIGDTWSTVKSWFGVSGMRGMGIVIPAIPLATLAALTGAAIVAINSCYAFIAYINSKTDRFSQLVNAGIDPITASKQATADAEQSTGVSVTSNIAQTAMWLALGIGAVVILPRLLK